MRTHTPVACVGGLDTGGVGGPTYPFGLTPLYLGTLSKTSEPDRLWTLHIPTPDRIASDEDIRRDHRIRRQWTSPSYHPPVPYPRLPTPLPAPGTSRYRP